MCCPTTTYTVHWKILDSDLKVLEVCSVGCYYVQKLNPEIVALFKTIGWYHHYCQSNDDYSQVMFLNLQRLGDTEQICTRRCCSWLWSSYSITSKRLVGYTLCVHLYICEICYVLYVRVEFAFEEVRQIILSLEIHILPLYITHAKMTLPFVQYIVTNMF